MATKNPQVARSADCRLPKFWCGVLVGQFLDRLACLGQDRLQLFVAETEHFQVKVTGLKIGQFETQQLFVPACVQSKFVVGDDESLPLCWCQMTQYNHRNVLHSELSR